MAVPFAPAHVGRTKPGVLLGNTLAVRAADECRCRRCCSPRWPGHRLSFLHSLAQKTGRAILGHSRDVNQTSGGAVARAAHAVPRSAPPMSNYTRSG
ncbi:hypothetical protein EXIGLDRAFT_463530 [Exidia glandulosa HHB12029]|uniref:Uncharacterized protein n=1 Tax=Exidia glandulosa HHB12029 TaxID=1314781 RepID=A0A165AZV7_EXIGL|nr:hypothetical protein EXIGLDRAFT_463530 [Exidia glandulosa HHB12029]